MIYFTLNSWILVSLCCMMSMCMQYSPIPDRPYLHISIRVVYNYCNSLVIIELISNV
uniref:Uncharacterized protein n=1 Tax=Microviridae sp. ctNWS1 TaxID=2826733 RepID=A0A8S5N4J9_9VIRU|nr:MAG TPA: hypothetical protein [Microviridae sp. ctNWS1]